MSNKQIPKNQSLLANIWGSWELLKLAIRNLYDPSGVYHTLRNVSFIVRKTIDENTD